MTLTSYPSAPQLSCAIQDIAIGSIATPYVLVAIEIAPYDTPTQYEQIYEEQLLPTDDTLQLTELSLLFTPYAEEHLSIFVRLTLTPVSADGSKQTATQPAPFTVHYSEADIDTDTTDFFNTYFLTIYQGTRRTAPSRLEYLSYIGTDAPTCQATYADGSKAEFTPATVSTASGHATIDASPSQFATDGKQLTSYTITAGQRNMTYTVAQEDTDAAPILLFTNSFGHPEIVYCQGTHQIDPSFARSSSRIRGLLRNYLIEETRAFKASTGPLTVEEAAWLDELFRSKEVYVCNAYQTDDGRYTVRPTKLVVITDSESKWNNDDSARPSFTFTYQYAQRTQNVLQLTRPGRIFDNTFDYTFG